MKTKSELQVVVSALVAASSAWLGGDLRAAVLVNESFTGTDWASIPNWYQTGGGFWYQNNEAFNANSSQWQFFTSAFASTDIGVGEKLSLSFNYTAVSGNISWLYASLYGGTAATANGWNQWSSGNGVSDTWSGYAGGIATAAAGASHEFLRAEGTASDYHPYATWDTAALFYVNSGPNSTLATGSPRAAQLVLENTGSAVSLTLLEGATLGSLSPIYTASDSTAGRKTTGYNVVSLYMGTSSGNGEVRYDNVLVELVPVPEPTTFALLGLGGLLLVGTRRAKNSASVC
ncbi:MAG: PEP-CTERM sorting domain-containing protein [Verrucomicrobia bacterium]|jgi:hypothetical protein|nr:PEP-CTERM sorting domain-containing protein [Verrucomicrobiota bacterium]